MTKKWVNSYPFCMKISYELAGSILEESGIVALPTDTLYGLSAKYNQQSAVQEIFSLKGRPHAYPLIILLPDISSLLELTSYLPDEAMRLAYSFWPGPLTLILPANTDLIPSIVRAGKSTCAFRIPANPALVELMHQTGPLVSPSANPTGFPPPSTFEAVEEYFGSTLPIVESDHLLLGSPSTIVEVAADDHVTLHRLGAIPEEALSSILGYLPPIDSKSMATCKKSHGRPLTSREISDPLKKVINKSPYNV